MLYLYPFEQTDKQKARVISRKEGRRKETPINIKRKETVVSWRVVFSLSLLVREGDILRLRNEEKKER